MNREEQMLAEAISHLNKILQNDEITSINLGLDDYTTTDGTKRINIAVDYIPKKYTPEKLKAIRDNRCVIVD